MHISPMRRSTSQQFVASLKLINDEYTYGHDKKQETGPVVVGFDSDRFLKYCNMASPDYDLNFADFNEITREVFQAEGVWVTHDFLVKAMELLSKYHGFTFCIEKETVGCTSKGENKTSCACMNGALKAGCTFHSNLHHCGNQEIFAPNSTVQQ